MLQSNTIVLDNPADTCWRHGRLQLISPVINRVINLVLPIDQKPDRR